MDTQNKIKRCSVKLFKLSFIGSANPTEIQEQILDQRVKRCAVKLTRVNEAKMHMLLNAGASSSASTGIKLKRLCIRLPRLNVSRSDISSPAASIAADTSSENEI